MKSFMRTILAACVVVVCVCPAVYGQYHTSPTFAVIPPFPELVINDNGTIQWIGAGSFDGAYFTQTQADQLWSTLGGRSAAAFSHVFGDTHSTYYYSTDLAPYGVTDGEQFQSWLGGSFSQYGYSAYFAHDFVTTPPPSDTGLTGQDVVQSDSFVYVPPTVSFTATAIFWNSSSIPQNLFGQETNPYDQIPSLCGPGATIPYGDSIPFAGVYTSDSTQVGIMGQFNGFTTQEGNNLAGPVINNMLQPLTNLAGMGFGPGGTIQWTGDASVFIPSDIYGYGLGTPCTRRELENLYKQGGIDHLLFAQVTRRNPGHGEGASPIIKVYGYAAGPAASVTPGQLNTYYWYGGYQTPVNLLLLP